MSKGDACHSLMHRRMHPHLIHYSKGLLMTVKQPLMSKPRLRCERHGNATTAGTADPKRLYIK